MKKHDKETATLQNAQATSATSARTTETAVTTYRNALEATGVNLLGWLEDFMPEEATNDEFYHLLDKLAESYDIIDEDGNLLDFYSAYVTDATPEQAQQLRTNYDTIYIAYSAAIDKYVLLTTWYGCSMEQIPVRKRTTDKVQYLTGRLYDGLKNMSFTAPLVEYIAANIEDGDILNELREVRPMLILQANPPHNICDKYGAEMESYLSNEYGLTDLTPEKCVYILVVEIICAPHLIQLTA